MEHSTSLTLLAFHPNPESIWIELPLGCVLIEGRRAVSVARRRWRGDLRSGDHRRFGATARVSQPAANGLAEWNAGLVTREPDRPS